MNIKTEAMPTPVKYVVTLDPEDVEQRKKECYEKVRPQIAIPGFRKGNVPQDVAENRLGIERIYKPMIDQIFRDIMNLEPNVVSTSDFKFFGDLRKKSSFTIEFVADIKPLVKLPDLKNIKIEQTDTKVTDEDFKEKVAAELKKYETIIDLEKDALENFDIAIIDFEGRLEGEATPFKGGTAKGYQIKINEITNGQKQFIDTFEDQLIGMKKDEIRQVFVTFPANYRETTLAAKKAIFTVTLKAIKQKIEPVYQDFVKSKGFETIEDYEKDLKIKLADEKKKTAEETFKKQTLTTIINRSEISPIPKAMVDRESEKEWNNFLRRMGKTEEQFIKENKMSKESFFDHYTQRSVETVKASLVLEQVSKDFGILVTDDEVVEYTMKVSNILKFDPNRQEKIKEDLKTNLQQFDLMRIATLNEKTIEFLLNEVK